MWMRMSIQHAISVFDSVLLSLGEPGIESNQWFEPLPLMFDTYPHYALSAPGAAPLGFIFADTYFELTLGPFSELMVVEKSMKHSLGLEVIFDLVLKSEIVIKYGWFITISMNLPSASPWTTLRISAPRPNDSFDTKYRSFREAVQGVA